MAKFRHIVSTLLLGAAITPALDASSQIIRSSGSEDSSRPLNLAADSPYRDPDIIYLEADELISSESEGTNIITAQGEVEGRYQDRTLRADSVVYNLATGQVIATGNVALIDSNGSTQYADKLELSNELEAGTAANFTSRFENGGVTGATLATRRTGGGIELYNAYYTACEVCADNPKPTWQLKARKVSQVPDKNLIRYNDVFLEAFGVPFFYLPFLAHPDTTQARASGILNPSFGVSSSKGPNVQLPYFIAVDPYTDLTLTPHLFTQVNPIVGVDLRRKFYSGEININSSLAYDRWFDNDGNAFADPSLFNRPDLAPLDQDKLRSHTFATGLFDIDQDWQWGFGAQFASDDLYLDRYDLEERPAKFGLYESDARRLVSQFFTVGQNDNFRFATSAYGFQSLFTTIRENTDGETFTISGENDDTLPIIAPKIELNKFISDPVLGGRLNVFGDFTMLTRKEGTDYLRGTGGAEWNKTFIAPGGIEIKPFGEVRFDHFNIEPENSDDALSQDIFSDVEFSRTLGQAGVDLRWPFINSGNKVNFIVEPRALLTQNFGDSKIENFSVQNQNGAELTLFQDSLDIDLDQALFWSPNKSTGFDFWQEGFRADLGGAVTALWDDSSFSIFAGKSFASGFEDDFENTTGLSGNESDWIGLFNLDLNRALSVNTRLRFDGNTNKFRRLDSSLSYRNDWLSTSLRYYKIDSATQDLLTDPNAPAEEITGSVNFNITDNWSVGYTATHDLGRDLTRRQNFKLGYRDDCTLVEIIYAKNNFNNDLIRDRGGLSIRFALLTLGEISPK